MLQLPAPRTICLASLPLLVVALTAGCVTKKDHEALQRELDETRQSLQGQVAERDQRVQDLSDALASEQAKLAEANDQIADLEQQIAQLETDLATMQDLKRAAEDELAESLSSRSKLKESIDDMRQALMELNQRRAVAEARVNEYKKFLARFQPLIDAGKLDLKIIDGRMVLRLPTDILFASASASLSKSGKEAISEVGEVLVTIKDREFQIEGHTDNDPIRTKDYRNNWELASARSYNVLKTLLDAGVKPKQLSAASFGEYKPAANNKTKEGKAKNRRIEIIVVPDLSELPGFDELMKLGGGKS